MKLPIAKPLTSRENKTGDWRTFKPIVDNSTCIKCAFCATYCPEACVGGVDKDDPKEREFPKMDYDYCKGCGICANVCPKKSITMVQEEK